MVVHGGASLSTIFPLASVVLYIELAFILLAAGELDSIDDTVDLLRELSMLF